MGVAVPAQRIEEMAGRGVELDVVGRLFQFRQPCGHPAVEGFGDDLGR